MTGEKPPSINDREVQGEAGLSWSHRDETALRRKIDQRIFPITILLFILNFIDRNSFANARLKGLEQDLHLTDVEYQTCLSILLVGYVSIQIPSNMILNKLSRPSRYLCACVATWGVVSACTGAVHNATGAILCRFFLGCVEASLFPGTIYFLSRWYTRQEMQLRVTLLNAGNLAAQAFGGLIAAGILGDMEGKAGLRAWRWLFIIEGAITIFVAVIAVFILPDYPSTTVWLTKKEKYIAQKRLDIDVGIADQDATDSVGDAFHGLKQAVMDPKVWLLGISYHCTIMGLSVSQWKVFSAQSSPRTVQLFLPDYHPIPGLRYNDNPGSDRASLDLGSTGIYPQCLARRPNRRTVSPLSRPGPGLSRGLHYRHDDDDRGASLCVDVFDDQ
jgi:MFS family permease